MNLQGKIGELIGAGVAIGFGLAFLDKLATNIGAGNGQNGIQSVETAISSNLDLLGLAVLAIIFAYAWSAYESAHIGKSK